MPMPDNELDAVSLARRFHEAYERLAPAFGYETRRESATPWADVPDRNKRLMVAVCAEILAAPSSAGPAERETVRRVVRRSHAVLARWNRVTGALAGSWLYECESVVQQVAEYAYAAGRRHARAGLRSTVAALTQERDAAQQQVKRTRIVLRLERTARFETEDRLKNELAASERARAQAVEAAFREGHRMGCLTVPTNVDGVWSQSEARRAQGTPDHGDDR